MALKDEKGRYHRITGIFIQNGYMEVKIAKNYDETERKEEPEEARYFNVSGIKLTEDQMNELLGNVYPLLKTHKTNIQEVRHPEETDEEGEIVKEAWVEETFDQPFKDMKDC